MRLECRTLLAAPVERVREELTRPTLLNRIAAPILTFAPVHPAWFPERWEAGTTYRTRLLLGDRFSLGEHRLQPQADLVEPVVWRDVGGSDLIPLWQHKILLEDVHGMTRYTDRVEIHGGWLTGPVWLFAKIFYWHRQRQLNRLVAQDFAPDAP